MAERDCPDPASGVNHGHTATVTEEWAWKTLDTWISLGPAALGTENLGQMGLCRYSRVSLGGMPV